MVGSSRFIDGLLCMGRIERGVMESKMERADYGYTACLHQYCFTMVDCVWPPPSAMVAIEDIMMLDFNLQKS